MISVVFFGTSPFAIPALDALVEDVDFKILAVVTQEAKPTGRNKKITPSPVALKAQNLGLPIFTPSKVKDILEEIKKMKPDGLVVAAYGQILPPELLKLPRLGAFNIHPSLLPKYRGASPIQGALLAGEQETGVTIILMDEEMDHGPILKQIRVAIGETDTAPDLLERASHLGADLLIETLKEYAQGKLKATVQTHKEASYTKILDREDGQIDFNHSTKEIYNQWRAFLPWPGIYASLPDGKKIKFLNCRLVKEKINSQPGTLLAKNSTLLLVFKDGALEIVELQIEGKKAMLAKEFINGYKNKLPMVLA